MKKQSGFIHKKRRISPADAILFACVPLILLCLLGIIAELAVQPRLSAGAAAYYGGMLEYPIAALALLTGGVLLAERISADARENRR